MNRVFFLLVGLIFFVDLIISSPCPSTPPPSVCAKKGGNFQCNSGNFNVAVTGNSNVPFFTFSYSDPNANQTTQYFFKLQKLYEATYTGGKFQMVGGTMTSLPSLTWNISLPYVYQQNITNNGTVYCQQETRFNIVELTSEDKKIRWSGLQFNFHMGNNNGSNSIKFDFIISDYQWSSLPNNSTYLVLDSSINSSNSSQNSSLTMNNGTIQIGNAFFSAVNTANAMPGNMTIDVALKLDQTGNNGFSLIYESFPSGSTLTHDPTFGVNSSSPPSNPSNNNIWIIIGATVGAVVVVLVVVIIGVIIWKRRKSTEYESM